MTIKERKLILHFLEMLYGEIEDRKVAEINPIFLKLFSRKELIEIVLWLYSNFDKVILAEKDNEELLALIGTDSSILAYLIEYWKNSINSVPILTQEEVYDLFERIPISAHYLRDKPVKEWDDYDVSNYYSLLFRHGKTKRVYAIFTSDVKEEDKYVVTTPPSFFFDTYEEAEDELDRVCLESKQSKSDFVIYPLWKIN